MRIVFVRDNRREVVDLGRRHARRHMRAGVAPGTIQPGAPSFGDPLLSSEAALRSGHGSYLRQMRLSIVARRASLNVSIFRPR